MSKENSLQKFQNIINHIFPNTFELIKILKNSSFTKVFLVKNKNIGNRLECIKLLNSLEHFEKEKFVHEGNVLGLIKYPNFPKIYDIIKFEEFVVLRTEFIDGFSLDKIINYAKSKNKKIPLDIANNLIYQLQKTLYKLHKGFYHDSKKVKIYHRDIKPSNIIISISNDNYSKSIDSEINKEFLELFLKKEYDVHLIDFGLVKIQGYNTGQDVFYFDKVGTIPYMSPKQAGLKNNSYKDWMTDSYQLMLVYYEIITQQKAYENNKKILKDKTKDFKIKIRQFPKRQKIIIETATKINPKKNYSNEKVLLKNLHKLNRQDLIFNFLKNNATIISFFLITLILLSTIVPAYNLYDSKINSLDTLKKDFLENNKYNLNEITNISELEKINSNIDEQILKIKKRAIKEKYLPYLKNNFYNFPSTFISHTDANNKWVHSDLTTESFGHFINLLLEIGVNQNVYDYYLNKLVNLEIEKKNFLKFYEGLIPVVQTNNATKSKITNLTSIILNSINQKSGVTVVDDLIIADYFLKLKNTSLQEPAIILVKNFLENNVDEDGYLYEIVTDLRQNKLVPKNYQTLTKRNFILDNYSNENYGGLIKVSSNNSHKQNFAPFTLTYLYALDLSFQVYTLTNNTYFKNKTNSLLNYYLNLQNLTNNTDYLFLKANSIIPSDTHSLIKSINTLTKIYNFKPSTDLLKCIILKKIKLVEKVNTRNQDGILHGNVLIKNMVFEYENKLSHNVSLIEVDYLFLKK